MQNSEHIKLSFLAANSMLSNTVTVGGVLDIIALVIVILHPSNFIGKYFIDLSVGYVGAEELIDITVWVEEEVI